MSNSSSNSSSNASRAIKIARTDPRYAMLRRSRNLRWDANEAEAVAEIELCESAEQAAEALQRIVTAGMRPTIRSGGHCYGRLRGQQSRGSDPGS